MLKRVSAPAGGTLENRLAALAQTRFWLLVSLLGLAALLLRLPTLSSRSLWLDETYSAWFAALPLHELWTRVPLYETHPPLYYTLLKAWSALAGRSEAGLRSLSALASVLTVVLIPAGARLARLGGAAERIALLAGLFLALNANSILFAQQARPYALQTLTGWLAVFCSCVLLTEVTRPGKPLRKSFGLRISVAGLACCAGLTLWLHNTGVFAAFGIWTGMTVALLLNGPGPRRRQMLAVGLAGIGALLVWSPFIPMLILQSAAMDKLSYWITFKPRNVTAAWSVISGWPTLHYPAAALALAGFYSLWRRSRLHFWHLLCVLALPVLALAAYSYLVKPVFLSRLFAWLAPLGMVLLALGVAALRARWRLPVVAVMLALSMHAVLGFYRLRTEDWREMLAQLAHETRPGDLILAFPNEVQMPLAYYTKPGMAAAPVVYLPGPFPALGLARGYTANAGAPNIGPEDAARVRALVAGHRRVWLIERRADLYDPRGLVMGELARTYQIRRIIDGNGATIRLYEMKVPTLHHAGKVTLASRPPRRADSPSVSFAPCRSAIDLMIASPRPLPAASLPGTR
jgi:mannosyltransferase